MSITADLIRGHTEMIILAQLLHGDSYGYQINKATQEKTGNQFALKEATLYTAFRRLEDMGCIYSYWGDEQSGARRRYYSITERGRKQYEKLLAEWRVARELIDKLVAEEVDNG